MSVFQSPPRPSKPPRPHPTGRAMAAAAVAALLTATACTAAPAPQESGAPPATGSAAASPSESAAGSGSAAQCPPLTATVPTAVAQSGPSAAPDSGSSALTRSDGGTSAVSNATLTRTGPSAGSSGTGDPDAAVLVSGGSRLFLGSSSVTSSGTGTDGIFSTGTGSLVQLGSVSVSTEGPSTHAVRAGSGGALTGADLTLSTAGDQAGTVFADGGEISFNRTTARADGESSAALHSAGNLSLCGSTGSSARAEGALIEGANSLISTRSEITGATHGAHLSASGGADGASLTVSGGTLTGTGGNAVLIEAVPATVTISDGARLSAGSGTLIAAEQGADGTVNVIETELAGNLAAERGSILTVSLGSNSSVDGVLSNVGLSLDTTSTLSLQEDSTATTLIGALIIGDRATNITGNGHALTYDPSAEQNAYLGGGTYTLEQGGSLAPE